MGPLQDIFETWAKFLYEENATLAFLRRHRWLILAVSAAIVIPCFWHRRIEAGDLASHAYNAWLAQLIQKGQAPGLYFSGQWNNVLFDLTLLWFAKALGLAAAQRIAVSVCVLTFFWGVFAFVNVVTERPPWFLAPCIAMLAYGYSFSMGFMNYCWSLGLACFALAIVWRPRRVHWIGGAIFALLAYVAHPIGSLWLVGMFVYVKLREKLPGWWKLILPFGAAAGFYAVFWYASHRPELSADWDRGPFYFYNGADQLALYGNRYVVLAVVTLCLGVVCVALDLFAGERSSWKRFTSPMEWYAVAFCATALVPENLRPSPDAGWIGLLGSRLTTVSAILGLCFLGLLKPRKWQLAGFGSCAVIFFAFLYQDTGWLNRLEVNGERLVSNLSPGLESRVIVTLDAPAGSRIQFIHHAVERACIGHCFSYANYEPSSKEFRVRVHEGNPLVTSSTDTAEDMAAGEYNMDESDLPMKQIYQCDANDLTKLCIRDLKAGDDLNIDIGRKPGHR
ncbi:MAG TPA: hypothetical protein VJN89_05285 [Candidatus Acidoferrum sp.]|nr:hypothetical protein [Candidatus Acidoferrum sp.]